MFQLPPLPTWNGLHPLIIHFPIALLLVAPLLLLVAIVVKQERGRWLLHAGLILMVLGTLSLFVAVATGKAAGESAERIPGVKTVLEHHEELAETARIFFSIVTAAFAAIVLLPKWLPRCRAFLFSRATLAVFLLVYAAGVLLLTNTAHQGGRLVHEMGVRAAVAPSGVQPPQPQADTLRNMEQDKH